MDFVVRKMNLHEADEEDIEYWLQQSPEKKLDALQELRELYYEIKNESRKGFQRVYRIVKRS